MAKTLAVSDTDLIRFMSVLKVPTTISVQIVRTYRVWLRSEGPEATISRLKSLKIELLTGSQKATQTWIARDRQGIVKGAFKPFMKKLFGLRTSLRVLTALVSCQKSNKLTKSQWDKFISSCERTEPERLDLFSLFAPDGVTAMQRHIPAFQKVLEHSRFNEVADVVAPPDKRFVNNKDGPWKTYRGIDLTLQDHLDHPPSVNKQFIGLVREATGTIPFPSTMLPYSGQVALIQERGLKARWIANPVALHQVVLSKLGNALYEFIRLLPHDCTFDQSKGCEFVQDALIQGKTVYSFDLSDATNNMPLSIQLSQVGALVDKVMRRKDTDPEKVIWVRQSLEYFRYISRGYWSIPPGIRKELEEIGAGGRSKVTWTVGQPLGLYPSFPLFALSHGMILMGIELRRGVSDTFRVLGDDVVITDAKVAESYRYIVNDIMGVPISLDKSLVSSVMGEFAGKIITRKGVVSVEKWKEKQSILSWIPYLGVEGIYLLPRRYRKFMAILARIPKPLGLGFNPEGKTFNERIPEKLDDAYLRSAEGFQAIPLANDQRARRLSITQTFVGLYTRLLTFWTARPRQEERDPVYIEHLNWFVKNGYGYKVADQLREQGAKPRPVADSSVDEWPERRFWRLFRLAGNVTRKHKGPKKIR